MSVVAKILIVLNLVLAVVFLGASASFLGQKESWKTLYETETAELNDKIETLGAQVDEKEGLFRQQETAAMNFKNERDAILAKQEQAANDLEQFRDNYNKLNADNNRLSETYKNALAQIDQLRQDLNNAVAARDTAQAESRSNTDTANNAVTEQKRLESEIADAQDQIAGLEKQIVTLSKDLEAAGVKLQAYKDKFGVISEIITAPALSARVSAVDEKLNIVVLSIGKDEDVKAGYEFTIFRGDKYVGKVIIDDVQKDHCSGYSKKELQSGSIKVGDDARTRF